MSISNKRSHQFSTHKIYHPALPKNLAFCCYFVHGNEQGKKDYESAKEQAKAGVESSQKSIDKWNWKIQENGLSKRYERKLNEAKAINSNFNAVLSEMNELEQSTTTYYLNSGASYSSASTGGNLGFDLRRGKVMINYVSGVSLMVHELKHASQYEKGTISLERVYKPSTNTWGGDAYDVYDKQEAYGREGNSNVYFGNG